MPSLTRVFSKRKLAGEGDRYRPGAQQRQVDEDDFFPYRFDAFLICKNFMFSVYHRILRKENEPLLAFIKSDAREASGSTGDNVFISCISTGLSAADRSHLVDAAVTMLAEEAAIVIELSSASQSAHDILVEAAKSSIDQWRRKVGGGSEGG